MRPRYWRFIKSKVSQSPPTTIMDYTGMFSQVIVGIVAIVGVVLPIALGLFAILLALRYGKKAIKTYSEFSATASITQNDIDERAINDGSRTKEQVEAYYDRNIKPHM